MKVDTKKKTRRSLKKTRTFSISASAAAAIFSATNQPTQRDTIYKARQTDQARQARLPEKQANPRPKKTKTRPAHEMTSQGTTRQDNDHDFQPPSSFTETKTITRLDKVIIIQDTSKQEKTRHGTIRQDHYKTRQSQDKAIVRIIKRQDKTRQDNCKTTIARQDNHKTRQSQGKASQDEARQDDHKPNNHKTRQSTHKTRRSQAKQSQDTTTNTQQSHHNKQSPQDRHETLLF